MRTIEYLSPSSISLYKQDPEAFYLRYLLEERQAREPQNKPMAIGSAFDAFVKSYLYENLIGKGDDRFKLDNIFNAQVEQSQREWAWKNGQYVFEQYKQSGVLGDLMIMLRSSPSEPRFEFEIRGVQHGYREGIEGQFGEVVLLGKPDVDFIAGDGVHIILDFKVNNYCGYSPGTPKPGYLRMRSAGKTFHGQHKKCKQQIYKGVDLNIGCYLEDIDESWARQLAIYAWLTGEAVGSEFVTVIHQVICSYNQGGLPTIRVAELHHKVSKEFQQKVFDDACNIWETVRSDHFFRNMTKKESDSRCEILANRSSIVNEFMDICR